MYIIRICTEMDMTDSLRCSYRKRVLEQGCNFQRDSWQLDTGISEWSYYNFVFFNACSGWGLHDLEILYNITQIVGMLMHITLK